MEAWLDCSQPPATLPWPLVVPSPATASPMVGPLLSLSGWGIDAVCRCGCCRWRAGNCRFLLGKNKVMQVALGADERSEYRDNLSLVSQVRVGEVLCEGWCLHL